MLAASPVVRAAGALFVLLLSASVSRAQISLGIIDEKISAEEDRLQAALQQEVAWTFEEEPLKQVVDKIKERTGIPIVLATRKLEEAAINLETPVTVTLSKMTLGSFLRNALGELGLT